MWCSQLSAWSWLMMSIYLQQDLIEGRFQMLVCLTELVLFSCLLSIHISKKVKQNFHLAPQTIYLCMVTKSTLPLITLPAHADRVNTGIYLNLLCYWQTWRCIWPRLVFGMCVMKAPPTHTPQPHSKPTVLCLQLPYMLWSVDLCQSTVYLLIGV